MGFYPVAVNSFIRVVSSLFLASESWQSKGSRRCILKWFFSILDTYFSRTKGFICSSKVSTGSLTFLQDGLFEKPFFLKLYHNSDSQKVREMFKVFFVSIIELIFFSNDSYDSPNQSLHRTLFVCGERFNYKAFCFDPCVGFVTVQMFQKVLITSISLDF